MRFKISLVALVWTTILVAGTSLSEAGPVTFNSALPVAKGVFILRGQAVLNRATDDPGSTNRDLRVLTVPTVLAYGATRNLALFGIVPYLDKTIVIDGGQWRYLRDGENEIDLPRPSRTTGLCKYLEDEFGYQSFEWYAGRIIELFHQALEDQNIPAAIELGYLMHQFKFKFEEEHERLAISGINEIERNREKGKRPKRRKWADELAELIISWDEIPDSNDPLIIETLETDLKIYRDGEDVVCAADGNVTKLARTTFERRYLRPSLKRRGH